MRKASRLFEIVQILRLADGPVTAAGMAASLGVASRSVYRDIAALQGMGIPVQGGRGIGYRLKRGFELPPLMFSIDETEALVLSLALLERIGDDGLKRAARQAAQKIAAAVPPPLRQVLSGSALHAWGAIAPAPAGIDLAAVRAALREERVLEIAYRDAEGRATRRRIWPIALIYYAERANIVAWCELRQDLRQFRTDRVEASAATETFFKGQGDDLRRAWVAGWTGDPAAAPA
ncbi:helix-turn-helix transcriptional regulator [Microvirga thermotolerans]|uniref:WYL domain-containing protein n=1 Tax=Microvirga thermotolerans TaxID=2651334 RepID=A0A5P9JYN6_9HYPH|nr:YafY family protein [Microvirga thermotolerans]QFU16375.1 WYL domain-containing protein [Microvirga thermotolerans]